jgi:hypothetical protein
MKNQNYIISLCQQISADGKTPSVALIRNYATRSLAIPEVIKSLQHYKANPNQKVSVDAIETEISPEGQSIEARVEHLEQQLKQVIETLNKVLNSR